MENTLSISGVTLKTDGSRLTCDEYDRAYDLLKKLGQSEIIAVSDFLSDNVSWVSPSDYNAGDYEEVQDAFHFRVNDDGTLRNPDNSPREEMSAEDLMKKIREEGREKKAQSSFSAHDTKRLNEDLSRRMSFICHLMHPYL